MYRKVLDFKFIKGLYVRTIACNKMCTHFIILMYHNYVSRYPSICAMLNFATYLGTF